MKDYVLCVKQFFKLLFNSLSGWRALVPFGGKGMVRTGESIKIQSKIFLTLDHEIGICGQNLIFWLLIMQYALSPRLVMLNERSMRALNHSRRSADRLFVALIKLYHNFDPQMEKEWCEPTTRQV